MVYFAIKFQLLGPALGGFDITQPLWLEHAAALFFSP